MEPSQDAVAKLFREHAGRVLASLARSLGGLDPAEDALQEAFSKALVTWPSRGVPDHPDRWLYRTARNAAVDRLRRDQTFRRKQEVLKAELDEPVADPWDDDEDTIPDDRLALMFTACHPALATEARVALTLRTLGGLTTPEIAKAFLVPETTMAQRIVRAKRKIRLAGIPYQVPERSKLPERLAAVLDVLYLVFNEGYLATEGPELSRSDLAGEAIRLGALVCALLPDEAEAWGLLALMNLQDSRRAARVDDDGRLVTLERQDRARWSRARIAAGLEALDRALALGRPGPFQVQAAIAAVHSLAPSATETDWAEIVRLYDQLHALRPTPVVALNRAAAVGMAEGAGAGLRALDEIADADALADYTPYHATRAELLARSGRPSDAAAAFAEASRCSGNETERRHLERRRAECLEA